MIAKSRLSPAALVLLFTGCTLEPHDQDARDHAPHAALERADDTACYEIRAHASAEAPDQKYAVPMTPSVYTGFRTSAPWSGTKYITSLRPLIDNQEVLVQAWLYAESGRKPGVARSRYSARQ